MSFNEKLKNRRMLLFPFIVLIAALAFMHIRITPGLGDDAWFSQILS